MGFVRPRDDSLIGIGQLRLEVGPREVVPRKAIGFGDAARDGVIGDGLFAFPIDGVADITTEGVVVAGEGLGVKAAYLLGDELAGDVVGKGGDAGGVGGGSLAAHCVVGIGDVGGGIGVVHGEKLAPSVIGVGRDDAVLRGVVEDLRDVLVAVMRVEEVEAPVLGTHDQRPCGDRLRRVPHKLRPHGITLRRRHRHIAEYRLQIEHYGQTLKSDKITLVFQSGSWMID